MIAGM